jgi:hypothetical protein
MAFRGKMDDDLGPVFAQQCGHKLRIADITAHHLMPGITLNLPKIPSSRLDFRVWGRC